MKSHLPHSSSGRKSLSIGLGRATIELGALKLNVPCFHRYTLYEPIIEKAYKTLREKLNRISAFKVDSNQLLTSCLSNLIKTLDEILMERVDALIKTKGFNPIEINALTNAEAKNRLKKFYQENHHQFTTESPCMKRWISVADFFLTHILTLFERLENDFSLIKKAFSAKKHHKLINIQSMGADRHNRGNYVRLIRFSDMTFIYKPVPVSADALIVGDLKRLAELDDSYKGEDSFLEILNAKLKTPLPRYLVIPRCDAVKTPTVMHQYGYIEYITHEPSLDAHLHRLTDEMETSDPKKRELFWAWPQATSALTLQNKAMDVFSEGLKRTKTSAPASLDYIATSHDEIKQFSFDWGVLMAVASILGIYDGHVENAIICQRRPRLIDLETSFGPFTANHEKSSFFKQDFGALDTHAFVSKEVKILFDITGINRVSYQVPAKNTLYVIERGQLTLCRLIPSDFMAGYVDVFRVFRASYTRIMKWMNSENVKRITVRYLPQSTGQFKKDMLSIIRADDGAKAYRDIRAIYLTKPRKKLSVSSYYNRNLTLPRYAIHLAKVGATQSPFSEFDVYCIPTYYTQISTRRLLVHTGEEIVTEDEPHFFPIELWSMIHHRLQQLYFNDVFRKALIDNIRTLVKISSIFKKTVLLSPDKESDTEAEPGCFGRNRTS